ncbi:calcium binding protein [Salix suchowensis]|nr:calcium binding protein [Salix suchowensis]
MVSSVTHVSMSMVLVTGIYSNDLAILGKIQLWSQVLGWGLRENRLSGPLPRELGNLSKLETLFLHSNNLTGRLPDSFVNLTSLRRLNVTGLRSTVSGNKLSGEIPQFIANFTNLTYLLVSDLKNTSFPFPVIGNLPNIEYLFLRNCSLTGGIPDYIGNNWKSLSYLDLSFNDLSGSIPQSLKNAPSLERLDLSYNNFADFIKDNITDPAHHDSTEIKTLDPGKPNMFCPVSLKYYGFCLRKGSYTVELHFAETIYIRDEYYSSSGTRIFDVYIQGERKLKDLNIIEMAKGPNEAWKTNFTAIVDENPLEIHFFWAGKGSLGNPRALNGPLVSAISVTPNFDAHDGKLSASQIAGITIGCAFAPLLLFLFAWQMRLLGNRELREKQIEVQKRSFTLQQIIDGTKNFSSKMEIGRGRFGVVYKANLPDQIKLAVKKISPPSEQREKDELKSEIGNLISLSHENLVQLLGGYSKKDLHLLIYEYMETGSLHKALFEQRHTSTDTELSWSARFDICLGIAKGLNYLHEEEEKSIKIKIVHGNINAKNILLDKTHTAKLSDFGLATIYNEEDPFTAIKARGSRVYMAPEHALGKAITVKADVYSYGVVVLEIVSGRSNTEYIPNQEADFLLDTAGRLHQQGRFLNLVDKKLGSRFDNKQALTLLHLAMECINQSPTLRPSMSEVVTKLSDIKASVPSSSSEVV